MNSEPKSIFTSQRDPDSKPYRDKITPPLPPFAPTTTPASLLSPTLVEPQSDREAGFGRQNESCACRLQVTTIRSRENSRELDVGNNHSTNATKQSLPSISDAERPSFRKPELPVAHAQSIAAPVTVKASKHPRSEEAGVRPLSSERASKRNRPKLPKPRHTLNPETFQAASAISQRNPNTPPSPLFFSHSPRQRPPLASSHSTSAAAVTIMSKARDEAGGVTTLKLARGSISAVSSPARSSTGTPGNHAFDRGICDRHSIPRSPDSKNKYNSGLQLLGTVGLIECLDQDDRLTFILDVANSNNFIPGPLNILYANPSLQAHEPILEMITGKTDFNSPGIGVTNDFPEFKAWALSYVKNGESLDLCLPSFLYGGITWTCSTLRKRLRVICGSACSGHVASVSGSSTGPQSVSSAMSDRDRRSAARGPYLPSPLAGPAEPADYFGDTTPLQTTEAIPPQPENADLLADESGSELTKQVMAATDREEITSAMMQARYPKSSSFDWTRLPISAALPRHIQFTRSIDWASTPLGPIENWGFDLRAMCNLIMGSPHPAAMYWGDEYTAIYNEAYILLAGQKHPKLMGQSYKDAWREIWPEIEPVFSSARESGQSTMKDDDCLFMRRNGFLEESYFSWSIIPLVGEDGSVVGLYNPAFEKTRRKIAERRMLTLREVGERTAAAREVSKFWGQVIKGLEYNEYDVPFVFLYSVSEDPDSDIASMHSGSLAQAPQCVLEGTLGVPNGHRAAMSPLDLKHSEDAFAPHMRESMKTNKPVLLTTEAGTLSPELIEGLEWRGWGDPCRAAVVCPIHPTTGDNILGFLVLGVNPRRPYDDDYSLFIQLLSRQLATSMASVVLFEDEIRRGQRAAQMAASERQELSKQLDLRTQEAVESETKFTRMAEFAPVGMFIANGAGEITYSNDTWWEISRHPRSENSANTWMNSIADSDREGVETLWKQLVDQKTGLTHEFRFKTPWEGRNGVRGETWVLMSAYPEKDEHGNLKSVFGSITNISQQKWAEDFQKRRMEEAVEMKRQQENFIDMTSHEMRNPLSAILQCSDEITTSLIQYRSVDDSLKTPEKQLDVLESAIDASQTIALCAQHQKRIVDDILTLSKLDSALLIVTPVAVQPISVVQRVLKMFEGELEKSELDLSFKMEQSYLDLNVDWVRLDPSRLLQVLINLTTNAIKFTQNSTKRTIIVSIGASYDRPRGTDNGVSYFPTRSKRNDVTADESEWGSGHELYLHFAVEDTGRGLDSTEKAVLFQRFSQASPRTHVQYGGSGLGLFISRQLVELQGGEIGVTSEKGIGSTFAFYIKARKHIGVDSDTPIANAVSALRRNSSTAAVTIEHRKSSSSGKTVHRSHTTGTRRSPMSIDSVAPFPPPITRLDHNQLKVLIVEDNLVNQKVLQKQLKNLGFKTEVANHGGEALEVLKSSKFWTGREQDGIDLDVILMDLEMPVMDGLTCARMIRDLEVDGTVVKHVPIIAVTANARMEQIETALGAGMDDVVSKPFRLPELIPKIDELVTKSKAVLLPLSTFMTTTLTESNESGEMSEMGEADPAS